MSYKVIQCQIAQDSLIYDYCDSNAQKAKLLYNAALFRIRQIFTGCCQTCRNRFLKLAEILKGLQAGSVKIFRKTADAALPEA